MEIETKAVLLTLSQTKSTETLGLLQAMITLEINVNNLFMFENKMRRLQISQGKAIKTQYFY